MLCRTLIVVVTLVLASANPASAATRSSDPFKWLERLSGSRVQTWIDGQNSRTLKRLEGDPRYETFLAKARAIFTADDRIAWPTLRAGGVDNLWQDAAHKQGIWRHSTLAAFEAGAPVWETLIDLDALSRAEAKTWVMKGATCLPPAETRCLIALSDGGGDAVELREFDTVARSFVPGGFRLANGKQNADWLDADTLIVGREWVKGEVTASGYAYVLKTLTRDGKAAEVFRGKPGDVSAQATVLRPRGLPPRLLISRSLTFFEREYSLLDGVRAVPIPLPARADYETALDGQMIFSLKADWNGFRAGDVVAYDMAGLGKPGVKPSLVFSPQPNQAVQQVDSGQTRLIVSLLEDVKGVVESFAWQDGTWQGRRLDLPKGATLTLRASTDQSDRAFFAAEGFLDPTALWVADAVTGTTRLAQTLPARFNADGQMVAQFWATSTDGTRIPYFVVMPKGAVLDGHLPTLMYGYGGFEVAKPPIYLPEMGKLWLEQGGAYVIANIRGGGEFGPAWHEAALRENRQRSFDDFAAVARDLAARGITSPRRLGIYGRSNGGVLTTVSMTQHPELWNAVVVESPLIDMLAYSKLSAGASWIGEYGDPDIAADRAFIARYSAYQNLKPGVAYPEPYITTNSHDDRVHPGHARKFAARLQSMGLPYLYYEQTLGGHANEADPDLNSARWARHYVYLAQKLMD